MGYGMFVLLLVVVQFYYFLFFGCNWFLGETERRKNNKTRKSESSRERA